MNLCRLPTCCGIAGLLVMAAGLLGGAGVLLARQAKLFDRGQHSGRFAHWATDPEAACGPVSVALVARWLDKPTPLCVINEYTRTGFSGVTSLFELQGALRAIGLQAEAVRLNPREAIRWTLPTVLHVNDNHFVAVLPLANGHLVAAAPPAAPRVIGSPSELGDWEGITLVVARSTTDLDDALLRAGLNRR